MPVYRAELPRSIILVVALFLMTAAAGVFACEFGAPDIRGDDHPAVQALRSIAEREQTRTGTIDLNRSFETCFVGLASRASATAGPNIRSVE